MSRFGTLEYGLLNVIVTGFLKLDFFVAVFAVMYSREIFYSLFYFQRKHMNQLQMEITL